MLMHKSELLFKPFNQNSQDKFISKKKYPIADKVLNYTNAALTSYLINGVDHQVSKPAKFIKVLPASKSTNQLLAGNKTQIARPCKNNSTLKVKEKDH